MGKRRSEITDGPFSLFSYTGLEALNFLQNDVEYDRIMQINQQK